MLISAARGLPSDPGRLVSHLEVCLAQRAPSGGIMGYHWWEKAPPYQRSDPWVLFLIRKS